ncbi:hypothetical protein TYRP_019020 [Tyrophagus putrescentiae]|nr:hypothetical protein TYRP_019020 [Tyrophagus putrescentiae]
MTLPSPSTAPPPPPVKTTFSTIAAAPNHLTSPQTPHTFSSANKSDINERSMASHWALSIDVIVLKLGEHDRVRSIGSRRGNEANCKL